MIIVFKIMTRCRAANALPTQLSKTKIGLELFTNALNAFFLYLLVPSNFRDIC